MLPQWVLWSQYLVDSDDYRPMNRRHLRNCRSGMVEIIRNRWGWCRWHWLWCITYIVWIRLCLTSSKRNIFPLGIWKASECGKKTTRVRRTYKQHPVSFPACGNHTSLSNPQQSTPCCSASANHQCDAICRCFLITTKIYWVHGFPYALNITLLGTLAGWCMGSDLVPIGTNLWPPTDVQESQLIKQLLLFSSLVLQGGAVVHNSNTCYKFLVDISNMIELELANGSFFSVNSYLGGHTTLWW